VNFLEKLSKLSAILAAVVIPIVIAVVGQEFSQSLKTREIQGRFVELAIEILKQEPTPQTESLRKWAVDVIDRYSGVPIQKAAKADLIEKVPLPRGGAIEGINYGVPTQPREIREVIISDTQTRSAEQTIAALRQLREKTPGAGSYHYLIDKEGQLTKLVDESLIAFSARQRSGTAIAIGLVHVSGEQYPDKQISALTDLLADIAQRYHLEPAVLKPKSELDPSRSSSDLPALMPAIRETIGKRLEGMPQK